MPKPAHDWRDYAATAAEIAGLFAIVAAVIVFGSNLAAHREVRTALDRANVGMNAPAIAPRVTPG